MQYPSGSLSNESGPPIELSRPRSVPDLERSASLNAASQTMVDVAKSARGDPSGFMWLTPRVTV